MTSLLDNPLILKYFGYPEGSVVEVCEHEINLVNQKVKEKTALHILGAMQEPVKKGELTLSLRKGSTYEYDVEPCPYDFDGQSFHSGWLRLPSSFQPSQTKGCDICHRCGQPLDRSGTTDYKWDMSGGIHSCIHIFKPTPPPCCFCMRHDGPCPHCSCGHKPLPAKDDVDKEIKHIFNEFVRLARGQKQ